jgi:DNA-binding protein HU-beta
MVDRLVKLIQTGVREEGHFPLTGLGTFAVGKRAERTGRNPAIGEKLKIKATNTAKFRAAPDLKAAAKRFKAERANSSAQRKQKPLTHAAVFFSVPDVARPRPRASVRLPPAFAECSNC